ncbi:MAG: hypothetical protein FWC10_09455 [Lentimicrobiaceae bacterium]|nr:hypothetical protein [Lentimicrobiaceae bacterium]
MKKAYVVLPSGEWLHLEDDEMHYDVIKRSGFLDDFKEDEPNAYEYYKNLGYAENDEISDEDMESFDDIEFEYNLRAVNHALKKGVLRIRYFKTGEISRNKDVILINGDLNRISAYIIETTFKKFNVPNTTLLSIEDNDGNEIFNGTYDKYKQ